MPSRIRGAWLSLCTAYFVVAPAGAVVPLTYATLEPKQIVIGESARLTITNLGTGTESVTLPVVQGLDLQVVGHTSQIEFVNGQMLESTSIVVRVTPQIAGIFTIPGLTPKSQPLVLQVNPDHGPIDYSRPGNSNSLIRPPIAALGSTPEGVRLTADGSAFVRLSVPKREVYVGESVPVAIEVGMRAGFVTSLNGLPTLTGAEFTLNNLSHQPERIEKIIDGKPFTLLTWHSVLAAVKPGLFPLAVQSPLTVRIRTQPQRESRLDDLLGDPFLQNFFGPTVTKDINVTSPASELTVLALPTQGRPKDFSGAVGQFEIASEISPAAGAAGDPLTLRMRVSGSGNFDRVDSAMLDPIDGWKAYPPKSSFHPDDAIGYKGEKTFEQPLIASKSGAQTLPGLAFSYFDPAARRYQTARSAPLNVTISPSLADRKPGPQIPADATGAAGPAGATGAAGATASQVSGGLRPDHLETAATENSLIPLYLQPRFLALPSLLALGFAGGWLMLRRRASDPEGGSARGGRGASKALNRTLSELEAAARSGNAVVFFHAARSALQETLAQRWRMAAQEITAANVAARLAEDGEDIRQLFALADEAQYSGHAPERIDLARWMRIVRHQLTQARAP